MPREVVAAFDVDGTLTRRDTLGPFLVRACGPGRVARAGARHAVRLGRVAVGWGDRDAAKAALLATLLAGRSEADVERAGQRHASAVLARGLRPDTTARLAWHRRQGHTVVLVSASLRCYLDPLGRALGVDAVLCTELEVDGGVLTGRLQGPNCRGQAKVDRLLAWAGRRPAELWAYGDSAGDRELLALADHAERVGRSPLPASPF